MLVLGLTGLTVTTASFGIVAVAMVALNLYILYRLLRGPGRPELSTMALGGAVLLSQFVFWAGTAYYLETPTVGGFIIFALATQFMMVPFGLWFITLVFQESEHRVSERNAWPLGLAFLIFGNELAMSWTFAALVPGALPVRIDSLATGGQAILVALSSLWYYWPMGVSMLVLVRWTRLNPEDRRTLYALTATAFVVPWAFSEPIAGAVAMAVIMGTGVLILWRGTQSTRLSTHSLYLRAGVGAAFLVMGASWVLSTWLLPSSWGLAPFAGVMAAVMVCESFYLIRRMLRVGFGPWPSAAAAGARSPSSAPEAMVGEVGATATDARS